MTGTDDGHASVGAVAFPTAEPVSRGIATAEPVSQGGESPGLSMSHVNWWGLPIPRRSTDH
jgi:hypothetical protein